MVAAALAAALCVVVGIDHDNSDQLLGAVVLGLASLLVGGLAWLAQRALRPRGADPGPQTPDPPAEWVDRAARGETVRLRPGRRKWILILVGSLLFAIPAALMAVLERHPAGIAGFVMCGGAAFVSVRSLWPGGAFLEISPAGLLVRTPFNTRRFAWNEVEKFRVFEVQTRYSVQRFVGFDFRDRTPERQSLWQTINRGVSGVDGGLPDTYGQDPEQLADALNRLWDRHATERGPSPSEQADRRLAEEAARVDTSGGVKGTALVAAACIAVYVVELTRYGVAPSATELQDLGGATRGGEWWTLLAANLIHANPLHIGLNLLAWAVTGALLEREVGWARMAALVVFGGLCSIGLAVVLQPDAVTVGLSGVVFAALAWSVVRDPHRTRALGQFGWGMLPLGVIYTFLTPGTSIGGHLGGLAGGLVLALTIDRWRDP